MSRPRTASDTESSERPSKSQKTQHGSFAPSTARPRRAARACEKCRSSKLRCLAPDPSSDEDRCAHCVKMDLVCVYADPPPPRGTATAGGERDERLLRLEENVGKLLEIMQKGSGSDGRSQPMATSSRHETDADATIAPRQATLETLSHLAANDHPLPIGGGFDSWLSPPSPPPLEIPPDAQVSQVGSRFIFDTLVNAAADAVSSPHIPPSSRPAEHATSISKPADLPSISPNTSVDARKTPTSAHEHASEYSAPQARPIPKAGAGSRMAAFTEPSSHEAPFRPLAYNPDTFRNAEIEDNGGPSEQRTGGTTPKRGRGDPIDRGIFQEDEARALFDFFVEHVAFFMPIFQEPMTFDFVRHRSSFLLSTILAVAAKYNCTLTRTGRSSGPFLDTASAQPLHPVDEEKWFEMRALALSSYFQALISKVHCLEDVQAVLLQCAWGLQDRGGSPDPWMMTGSAYRLARRLGIHQVAGALLSGSAQPTARLVASLKTYMCLYAFDRFFTVGFGRPETEGFAESSVDPSLLLSLLEPDSQMRLLCSPESAACVVAYVELANIAKQYSRFVNVLLKESPSSFLDEMREVGCQLDAFSSRWLWARSPLAAKLGPAGLPIKMLYNHIRLCVHAVPLKPTTHPDSDLFMRRTGLQGPSGSEFLSSCLRKAQDCAVRIIQDFADDSRDDNDTVLCFGYDYAFMLLAHSAAILLSMTTISVCGITPPTPQTGRSTTMDSSAAKRYYEMAITAMVESNRSANFFPCDMACNLSLIAQEMGISVAEWMSDGRCSVVRSEHCACSHRAQSGEAAADLTFMFDIDQFLQPGFLDDGSLFSSTLLT